jgi:hypothetical protein
MGSGDPHHIDLKLLESLPIAQQVKAIDTLSNQYGSLGRAIEFSNSVVSGQRWDPTKDLSDKVNLLNRAAAAHSHSKHPGWKSLDFYVPFKNKSRFDKGAVEDASIFLPAIPGGKVRSASGGGYGYYSEALDPSGKVLFRVGHGNVDRPENQPEVSIAAQATPPAAPQLPQTTGTGNNPLTNAFLATMIQNQQGQSQLLEALVEVIGERQKPKSLMEQMKEGLIGNVLQQTLTPKNFLTQFTGSDPYLQGQQYATNQFLGM